MKKSLTMIAAGITLVSLAGCSSAASSKNRRALPSKYGKWNTVYQRLKRWSEKGIIQKIFLVLQAENILKFSVEIISLDSTSIKVHPDGHGAVKKRGSKVSESQGAAGTPNFMWLPLMLKDSQV